jgi:hypothetical protein
MPDVDDLDRCIGGLQRLQRMSWQQLADQSTTADESRAARSQLRKTSSDLRALLEMRLQRSRFARRGLFEEDVIRHRTFMPAA